MIGFGRYLGAAILAVGLTFLALDLRTAVSRWSTFGPLASGEPVPEFAVSKLDGTTLRRADLEGRVSVVTFWASWCGVCSTEMPMYQDLHQIFADDPKVQIVLVNREGGRISPAQARPIVERTARARGLTMPMAIDDGSLYGAMGASVLPHTVVVDRDGVIRHVHPGRVMRSTLESEVATLLE